MEKFISNTRTMKRAWICILFGIFSYPVLAERIHNVPQHLDVPWSPCMPTQPLTGLEPRFTAKFGAITVMSLCNCPLPRLQRGFGVFFFFGPLRGRVGKDGRPRPPDRGVRGDLPPAGITYYFSLHFRWQFTIEIFLNGKDFLNVFNDSTKDHSAESP